MLTLEHCLSLNQVEQLRAALLDLSASITDDQVLLQKTDFSTLQTWPSFSLLISTQFSALLEILNISEEGSCQLRFSLDTEVIAQYLTLLRAQTLPQRDQAQILRALDLHQQSTSGGNGRSYRDQFSIKLLAILSQASPSPPNTPTVAACQPAINAALTQQTAQEGLIHRVTTQIRQSLELPKILSTAAQKVRQILEVDRFVIYQFQAEPTSNPSHLDSKPNVEDSISDDTSSKGKKHSETSINIEDQDEGEEIQRLGAVTYESRINESIPSVLSFQEQYCWSPTSQSITRFQQGETLAIADVQAAYASSQCMSDFLQEIQVQAKLVVPILVKSKLWGLLIAHQCSNPRPWKPSETAFLRQISEHLSVAISQSQLYHQLSEQKQTLELQVQQRTQELQEALVTSHAANQAKSEFLATMSHELRTPLTAVIGMSATLLQWSFGPLTDKQRSYLQTIHDSGEHLLDLINDILDLSHLESGKATLNLSEFSLSSLAHQSLQVLRDKAHDQEISLKAQITIPTDSDRFTADPRQIKQILFNLLSNSIKFTPNGGTVTLRVWLEPNSVVFQVEDTGIGIPQDQQSLLFEKFQQLDTSYRRNYEGAGLGLALVKQFVDMHRGWIEVRSTEGQGSTFTVEIPNQVIRADNIATSLISSGDSPSASGGRILLIEHQDENAGPLCDILTAAGYQVIWAVNSATEFPQIKMLQPLVIILDTHLSKSDCLQLIRQVRQASQLKSTKLIVLLPQDMDAEKSQFLDAGADSFLVRPINPQHLLYKVETLVAENPI